MIGSPKYKFKTSPRLTYLDMYGATKYNRQERSGAPKLPVMGELWDAVDRIAADVGEVDSSDTYKALEGLYADHHEDMGPVIEYQEALSLHLGQGYKIAAELIRDLSKLAEIDDKAMRSRLIEEVTDRAFNLIPDSKCIATLSNCFSFEMWQVLTAGHLTGTYMSPDLDAAIEGDSQYEVTKTCGDKKVKVTWNGSALVLTCGDLRAYISGDRILGGTFHRGLIEHNIEEYTNMFMDWINPTREEILLFEMVYPGQFSTDIYKILDILSPDRKPIQDICDDI